jgi:hypothetical protein
MPVFVGGPHAGRTIKTDAQDVNLPDPEPLPRNVSDFSAVSAVVKMAKMTRYTRRKIYHGGSEATVFYADASLSDREAIERVFRAYAID